MTDQRQRTEIVSVRLNAGELAQIQALADSRGVAISTCLRESVFAAIDKPEPEVEQWSNPHARYAHGERWTLSYAPGRYIGIHPNGTPAVGVALRSPCDARLLAAALLVAADLAEQPDPTEVAA